MLALATLAGPGQAVDCLETRNVIEPMFVFAIMVIAATRPVLHVAGSLVQGLRRALPLPLPRTLALVWLLLALVPRLDFVITESVGPTRLSGLSRTFWYRWRP